MHSNAFKCIRMRLNTHRLNQIIVSGGKTSQEIKEMPYLEKKMHAQQCDKNRNIKAKDIGNIATKMGCPEVPRRRPRRSRSSCGFAPSTSTIHMHTTDPARSPRARACCATRTRSSGSGLGAPPLVVRSSRALPLLATRLCMHTNAS